AAGDASESVLTWARAGVATRAPTARTTAGARARVRSEGFFTGFLSCVRANPRGRREHSTIHGPHGGISAGRPPVPVNAVDERSESLHVRRRKCDGEVNSRGHRPVRLPATS